MRNLSIAGAALLLLAAQSAAAFAQDAPPVPPADEASPDQAAPAIPPAEPGSLLQGSTNACEARTAAIYFAANSDALDQASREAITTAANSARNASGCRVERVVLTGHADRSGDDAHNLALSRRRAEAVRDAFVAMGAPADAVVVQAEGETRATGDASRDRRVDVQITMGAATPAAGT